MTQLVTLTLIALAVATIAMTVTKASVFMPLRVYMRAHHPWPGKLVTCSYCTSHWAAFFTVALCRPQLVPAAPLVNYGVVAFAAVALATFIGWGIRQAIAFTPDPDLEV